MDLGTWSHTQTKEESNKTQIHKHATCIITEQTSEAGHTFSFYLTCCLFVFSIFPEQPVFLFYLLTATVLTRLVNQEHLQVVCSYVEARKRRGAHCCPDQNGHRVCCFVLSKRYLGIVMYGPVASSWASQGSRELTCCTTTHADVKCYLRRIRKGVMQTKPFLNTQRTTLIEVLTTVLERSDKL